MNDKKLYTLVIDYNSGTYVTQAVASSAAVAPAECVRNWDTSSIESEVSEIDKTELLSELENEAFTFLRGLRNVWCGSVSLSKGLMLMNLVETNNAI